MHWTPGGIYYSQIDGLYRISDSDGAPVKLTTLSDESEAQHQWPQLVEKDLLLYTAVGPSLGSGDSKLVLQDLATRSRVWELEDAMFGRYVPSGHIVYPRSDGTVLAWPFDLANRRARGAPTPILQGVHVGENVGGSSSWQG